MRDNPDEILCRGNGDVITFVFAGMSISTSDVIPLSQARAALSELADQVKVGAEKIVTKNGERYIAIIDARRLDYYHQLERERIHLLLIAETSNGMARLAERLYAIGENTELREYVMAHCPSLYTRIDGTVFLLSIRHHRQLSFDLASHWLT